MFRAIWNRETSLRAKLYGSHWATGKGENADQLLDFIVFQAMMMAPESLRILVDHLFDVHEIDEVTDRRA